MATDNDWSASGDDDEVGQARGHKAAFSSAQNDEIRRLARREFTAGWREVGVDMASYDKRQEHGELIRFWRGKKAKYEEGVSKVWLTVISAIASAIVAAGAALFSGHSK